MASTKQEGSFLMVPGALIYSEKFRGIGIEAKLLYAVLLDRIRLSEKNGWVDDSGRTYVICTVGEVQDILGTGRDKSVKIMNELVGSGLIEKKRQGLCRPNIIYVNDCLGYENETSGITENKTSGSSEIIPPEAPVCVPPEVAKPDSIHTDHIHNNFIHTDPIHIISFKEGNDANERDRLREQIKHNIDYDILLSDPHTDRELVDELLEIMLDVICSKAPTIRVSRDNKPADVVRNAFMKLSSEHITFVLDSMKSNTSEVRNIRQYLITALYNAPMTIGSYYQSLVNHDMYSVVPPAPM